MKRIFKYPLEITSKQSIALPINAKILCIKQQYTELVLYAEINNSLNKVEHINFIVVGTGHKIPDLNLEYIDTIITDGGLLVWHVYKEVL